MAASKFVPIAHIVAAVFAIIELGLTAYIASYYTNFWWGTSPSNVNFLIFTSIWSLLVLLYVGVVPLYMTSLFHKLAALGLLVVTTIFWFAGAIALAVAVGGPYNCGLDTHCGSTEAAIAFAFFLWAIFTFLTVLDAIAAMRSRGHNTGSAKGHTYPGA
ncbi:membrane-associating domain-containing protein [Xylariomycetidae sp. FL0641]|nr:membrane-associating domain-containing protein [Xylariomycetidae sp. FL0641]